MQRVFCALVLLKIVACNVNESIWTDPMTNTSLKTFEEYPIIRFFNGTLKYSSKYNLARTNIVKIIPLASTNHLVIAGQEMLYFFSMEKLKMNTWTSDKINETKIVPDEFHSLRWANKRSDKAFCINRKDLEGTHEYESICKNYAMIFTNLDDSGSNVLFCTTDDKHGKCAVLEDIKIEYNMLRLPQPKQELDPVVSSILNQRNAQNIFGSDTFWSRSFDRNFTKNGKVDIELVNKIINPPLKRYFVYESGKNIVSIKQMRDRSWIFYNEATSRRSPYEIRLKKGFVAQVCSSKLQSKSTKIKQRMLTMKLELSCKVDKDTILKEIKQVKHFSLSAEISEQLSQTVFILFTSRNDQKLSGICAYETSQIRQAFEGSIGDAQEYLGKIGIAAKSIWENLLERKIHPGFCPQPYFESETYEGVDLKSLFKLYNKMSDEVSSTAVLSLGSVRFTTFQMRLNTGPYKNYTMIYIGSEDGYVYKSYSGGFTEKFKMIERIKMFDTEKCSSYNKKELTYDRTVRDINIDEENNLLRVTFSRCVLWTKLDDCSVHKCTNSCFGSSDPNCGWSFFNNRCQRFENSSQRLHQNLGKVDRECDVEVQTTVPSTTEVANTSNSEVTMLFNTTTSLNDVTIPAKTITTRMNITIGTLIVIVIICLVVCYYKFCKTKEDKISITNLKTLGEREKLFSEVSKSHTQSLIETNENTNNNQENTSQRPIKDLKRTNSTKTSSGSENHYIVLPTKKIFRDRMQSDDSGRGKSLRNSYEDDEYVSFHPVFDQEKQTLSRKLSSNTFECSGREKRTRLISEPAYKQHPVLRTASLASYDYQRKPLRIVRPSPYHHLVLSSKPPSPRRTVMMSQPTTPMNCGVFTFPENVTEAAKYASLTKQHDVFVQPKRRRHASCNPEMTSNYAVLSRVPATNFHGRQRRTSFSEAPSYDFTRKNMKDSKISKAPLPSYEQHSLGKTSKNQVV